MRASVDELVEHALDQRTRARRREAQASAHELSLARSRSRQALSEAQQRADEAVKESVTAARVRERELEMAAISRLLESIRGLDGASSSERSARRARSGHARAKPHARRCSCCATNGCLDGSSRVSAPRDAQPKLIDLALAEAGVIGVAVDIGAIRDDAR